MITITLNKARGGSADAPFYALSAESVTIVGANVPDGTTVALLSSDGETLGMAFAAGNAATLDLNTAQAAAATEYIGTEERIRAALVIGDADNIIAVVGVDVGRNALDELAPPAELAPTYPTSESLLAILSQMTAQANRAEDAVEATEEAQKAVAEYVDVTFPTKVEQAEKRLVNATTSGVNAVTERANQGIGAISSHTTTIIGAIDSKAKAVNDAIDTKAQAVNSAFDNKLTTANTAIDGKVTEANQAKDDAVKAKDEAETAKEQSEGFASQASESAEQASKSAQQAEDAKTAIGDVGERLDAVETSVAEKVPYLSEDFKKRFNISQQYNIADNGQVVMNPCHKGWICSASYGRNSKNFDYYIAPNGEVTKTSVALFKDNYHNYKAHLIYTDKTIIFSENYRNEKVKCTIDDSGVVCEVLDAFPANVSSYNAIFGIINSHGFLVTTGGVILKGDTLEEVATFYAINTATAVISSRGDLLLGKNGDTYYYFDQAQKKWCKLVTDDNGIPSITVNTYTQNTNFRFAPLNSGWRFIATEGGFFRGVSDYSNGALYDTRSRLNCRIASFLILKKERETSIIFTADYIFVEVQRTGTDTTLINIGTNIFYKWYRDKIKNFRTTVAYNNFATAYDYSGNIIVAMFSSYHWGANQLFHILTEK